MKIAVPVKSTNQIDAHFGHCEGYKVFTIENNNVIAEENVPSPKGCGCKSDIASVLHQKGVTVMLAGGIGDGAVQVLSSNGIQVVRNCKGDANAVLVEYLQGNIVDGGVKCSHDHNHQCSH